MNSPSDERQSPQCPVCKSDTFLNPQIVFLVSPCYHRVCESCINSLFVHGSGPCPVCGTLLKKSNWTVPRFEDLRVERECRIRQKLAGIFTKSEQDFHSLRDYNDYLEEIEGIVFNLLNDVDVQRTSEKLEAYRQANLEQIARSRLGKEAEEAEWQKREAAEKQRRLEYEMQLVAELEEEERHREQEESRYIEELARSSAGVVPGKTFNNITTTTTTSHSSSTSRKRKVGLDKEEVIEMPSFRGLRERTSKIGTVPSPNLPAFNPFDTIPMGELPFTLSPPLTIPSHWFTQDLSNIGFPKAGGMQMSYLSNLLAISFIAGL